jgi:hypothetical protein
MVPGDLPRDHRRIVQPEPDTGVSLRINTIAPRMPEKSQIVASQDLIKRPIEIEILGDPDRTIDPQALPRTRQQYMIS